MGKIVGIKISGKNYWEESPQHKPWEFSEGSIPFSVISFNSFIFLSTKPCPMSKIVSPHFRNLLSKGVSKYCRANLLTALKRSLWERAKKFWTSLIKSSASGGGESSYNPRRVSNATVLTPGQKKLNKHYSKVRYFVFVLLWLGGSLE